MQATIAGLTEYFFTLSRISYSHPELMYSFWSFENSAHRQHVHPQRTSRELDCNGEFMVLVCFISRCVPAPMIRGAGTPCEKLQHCA